MQYNQIQLDKIQHTIQYDGSAVQHYLQKLELEFVDNNDFYKNDCIKE